MQPIRSTTQIWVVTRHHYAISALVSQISLGGETSGSVAKCRLFLRLVEGWSISRYVDCGTLCSVLRMDTRFHLVPKVLSYSNHRKYNQSAFTFDTFGYVSLTCLDFFPDLRSALPALDRIVKGFRKLGAVHKTRHVLYYQVP